MHELHEQHRTRTSQAEGQAVLMDSVEGLKRTNLHPYQAVCHLALSSYKTHKVFLINCLVRPPSITNTVANTKIKTELLNKLTTSELSFGSVSKRIFLQNIYRKIYFPECLLSCNFIKICTVTPFNRRPVSSVGRAAVR